MKRIKVLLFLLAICLSVSGQDPMEKSRASDEAGVRDAVNQMIRAWGHNDADSLARLWSDDYTFVNPAGVFLSKAQRLSMLRSGRVKVEDYSVDEEKVRVYGDAAVVTYRSTVRRQSEGREINSEQHLVTTMLIRQGGAWRAVAQQSTPVVVASREPGARSDK